jgi:hypothetical protein
MASNQDPSSPGNFTFGGNGNFTLAPNMTIWGPIPDDHRRSLQPDMIACAVITWLIGFLLVCLRFYTRSRLIHVIGPTDWCIAFSVVRLPLQGSHLTTWGLTLHFLSYALPA